MASSATIPHIPRAIPRPRLLDRLQEAAGQRLLLISAPPGYGKTTLAAQFAQVTDLPLVWHTALRHHRDIVSLHTGLLAAVSAVTTLPVPDLPPQTPAAELAVQTARYLERAFTGQFVLCLDDAHYLRGEGETWLQALVEHLPPSGRIVLTSRTVPPLSFAELLVRGQVLAVGARDLQMTVEEATQLAHLLKAPHTPSEIQTLVEQLDGWPAGIVLALRPLPDDIARRLPGAESGEALFNQLAGSMLSVLSASLREFLLASSTLSYLTPETCAALGLRDPTRHLEEVRAQNLFVVETPRGLAYHALFQEFLQNRLRDTAPQRHHALHARAAAWMEAQDRVDLAFEHYLAAQQYPQAADLAGRLAPAYFGQGRFETLLHWEAQLAAAGVTAARLTYECAVIHAERYDYSRAEQLLERARQAAGEQDDALALGNVQHLRAYMLIRQGQYQAAIDLAQPLVEAPSESLRGRALRVIGLAKLRLGQVEESIADLKQAEGLLRSAGLVSALSHLLQDLQLAYTRAGQLEAAGHCLQEVVALRRKLGGSSGLALALNNLGYHFHQQSDYPNAILTLEEGLREIARGADRRVEAYLHWSLGDVQRDLGLFDEAGGHYDRALALLDPGSDPNLLSSILTALSILRRRRGECQEAAELAEEAAHIAHGIAFERALAQAAFWAARAQLGEAEAALEHLGMIIEDLRQQEARFEAVGLLGVCTAIRLSQSAPAEANRLFEEAMRLAEALGTAQPLAAEIAASPALEELADERPWLPCTVSALERLRRARHQLASSSRPPRQPEVATYSLRVLTLGQDVVERNGVPVPASAWQAAAARELFYFLLLGPRSREEIGLQFWPEARDWQVFYTTMHRARAAVGRQAILFQAGLYRLNPDIEIWCDALELERTVQQARLLSHREARAEHLWRRAVDLYQGDFLAAFDAGWIAPRREAYHELYYEALLGLGQCARARDDPQEAIRHFRRAIEVEPYHEAGYQAIIAACARLGQKQTALSYFDRLRQVLRDELGVTPTQETEQLVEELLR